MDSSVTLAGKRQRAPAEGVMGSDIPTQSIDKRSRLGDPHLAFAIDKGVAREQAQWWQPEMKEKIDSQTRMDPGAPLFVDGGKAVLAAWVTGERNWISGQDLAGRDESTCSDLARKAGVRELDEWDHFRVVSSEKSGAQSKHLVDTRWVFT